jgi:hypothetical protein
MRYNGHTWIGRCDQCDTSAEVIVTQPTLGGSKVLCHECYDKYLDAQTSDAVSLRQDPDDERKYGKY